MGMRDRILKAALGITPLDRTKEKLLNEIERRAVQGMAEFVVSFSASDVGVRNRLDVVTPLIVEAIQNAGHAVVDVSGGGWSQQVVLRVRTVPSPYARVQDDGRSPGAGGVPTDRVVSRLEVEEATRVIVKLFHEGDLSAAWAHRLDLGWDVPREGLSADVWFWLNAVSALAGLRLGYERHPLTATSAGYAEMAAENEGQDGVVAEIRRLFFA